MLRARGRFFQIGLIDPHVGAFARLFPAAAHGREPQKPGFPPVQRHGLVLKNGEQVELLADVHGHFGFHGQHGKVFGQGLLSACGLLDGSVMPADGFGAGGLLLFGEVFKRFLVLKHEHGHTPLRVGVGQTHGLLPLEHVVGLQPAHDGSLVVRAHFVPSGSRVPGFTAGAVIDVVGLEGRQVALQDLAFGSAFVEARHRAGENAQGQFGTFPQSDGKAFPACLRRLFGQRVPGAEKQREQAYPERFFHVPPFSG